MKTKTEIFRQYNELFRLFELPPIQAQDVVAFMSKDGMNSLIYSLNGEVINQVKNLRGSLAERYISQQKAEGIVLKLNADVMTLKTSAQTACDHYNSLLERHEELVAQLELAKRMITDKELHIADLNKVIIMKDTCIGDMSNEIDSLRMKLARKLKRAKSKPRVKKEKIVKIHIPREYPEWQNMIDRIVGTEKIVNFYPDEELFGDFETFYRKISGYIHNENERIKRSNIKGDMGGRLHQHWDVDSKSYSHSKITVVYIED